MLRLLLFSTFLLCSASFVQAQMANDTLTPAQLQAEFLADLEDLMTDGRSKEVEAAYESFAGIFASGTFTPEEQSAITNTGLLMRGRKLGATPYFKDYLRTVVKIKEKTEQGAQLKSWIGVLDGILTGEGGFRVNNVAEFLKFSGDFYEYQAIKYSPASLSWFTFAESHRWVLDKQPILKVENADLTAMRSNDTLTIQQTNFSYFPLEKRLQGEGGKTSWEGTDLGPNVYAELEKYEVETLRSLYEAEVAYLYYPQYFGEQKVKGTFTDKLVADDSRTSYPRFESTDAYINFSSLRDDVKLRGGFRLHGATVYATGTKNRPAELLVTDDRNQPAFRGVGNLVTIKDQNRIVGQDVQVTLYLNNDSLFHPSANVRMELDKLSVELSRGKKGTDRYPFFHSLHQMNIDADFLKVYIPEDSLVIGRPTASFVNKADVVFESLEYFDTREYTRIQNIATANPLAIMKATAEREGTNFMPASLLANRINSRFTVDNILPLIYDLVSKGFIAYDPETQEIEMKEKIYHYVDAEAGNTDYDFLRLVSQTDTANATINLQNGYSLLNGVERIEFSRAQRVGALPSGNQAFVRGNRNFDFDGEVFAGYSKLQGKDFEFIYDDYKINLDSVRYWDLYVPTGNLDENNRPEALSLGSRIEHLQGVLLVDAPNNKSGRKDIPIFPSLQSKENSYIFYDSPDTRGGVYVRDSFYFELEPFSFDHLDRYGPQDVKFEGVLRSNGMFPDIEETAVIQEDQSLGFTTETPTEGHPAYDGKGTYTGELNLSNSGFMGKGKLEYIQAEVNAEDFVFMPTRATASADAFDLEEVRDGDVPVPEVHGEAVDLEWRPYSDSLLVKSTEDAPFQLFRADDHRLEGSLVLTPNGLKGAGKLAWSLAEANSNIFSFGANSADADTMQIRINALEVNDRLALETNNVNGLMDFDDAVGHFEANTESVVTLLPYNQYMTTMNEFDWDMKGSTITFLTEEDQKALFTSIHPDQDSLNFYGKEATYDLRSSLLSIEGVDYIVSSDAFIYPDSQYVEIAPEAEMAVLENAQIIADTTSKYHVINRATVQIKGRRVYEASGFYEYNVGPYEQEFELQNITGQPIGKGDYSEKRSVTRAVGEILPSDTFFIDHKTQFRGDILLDAEEKALTFDGYARFNVENLPNKYWFTVNFKGDKNDLVIDYDVPKSYDDEPLFSGLFLSREFSRIYPRLVTPLLYRKDRRILDVSTGVIKYLEDKDQLVYGDSSIVLGESLVGNKMLFKNSDGSVEAEGKFVLGSELKYVSIEAAGRAETKFPAPVEEEEPEEEESSGIMLADEPLVSDEPEEEAVPEEVVIPVTAEFMLGMEMLIPENLLKIVHNDFLSAGFEARAIGYLSDVGFYQKTVRELFPESKEREDALAGLGLGVLDVAKRVNGYDFLFSKVPMKWHGDYQSFVSTKKTNGLISVNGDPLNKQIESYIEVKMPSADNDDRLYIYVKSPSGLFYFFGFKAGILSITSNNTVFMQQLEGMKVKDLVRKMPDGETFEIQPVEVSSANLFLRRIQAVQ